MNNLAAAMKDALDLQSGSLLMFLACVTWPFYFFESGRPQLFVLFLIGFCLVVLYRNPNPFEIIRQTRLVSIAFAIFLGYSCVVNGYYAVKFGSFSPIFYSAYFALSFGIATLLMLSLDYGLSVCRAIYFGLAVSLLVQGLMVLVNLDDSCARQILFFNNPNQLAFYALLSLSLLVYLFPLTGLNLPLFCIASTISLALILVTHSRAALLCAGLLILIQLATGHRLVRAGLGIALILIVTLLLTLQEAEVDKEICTTDRNLITSFDDVSSLGDIYIGGLTSLQGLSALGRNFVERVRIRGYDRIWKFPEYLLLGSGEGLKLEYSFNGRKNIEFHSAVGVMMFSYGIVGSVFVIYLLTLLATRGGMNALLFIAPIFLYSLFHNILRQPYFWIFIILLLSLDYHRIVLETKRDPETQG